MSTPDNPKVGAIPRGDEVFISGPAIWDSVENFAFRIDQGDVKVISRSDDGDVIFPIHDRCVDIVRRVLLRRAQLASPESSQSEGSMKKFYELLVQQNESNIAQSRDIGSAAGGHRVGDYADYGIEYDHDYYGARQYWEFDGWQTATDSEVRCSPFAARGTY